MEHTEVGQHFSGTNALVRLLKCHSTVEEWGQEAGMGCSRGPRPPKTPRIIWAIQNYFCLEELICIGSKKHISRAGKIVYKMVPSQHQGTSAPWTPYSMDQHSIQNSWCVSFLFFSLPLLLSPHLPYPFVQNPLPWTSNRR